jgi:hypothetical protein
MAADGAIALRDVLLFDVRVERVEEDADAGWLTASQNAFASAAVLRKYVSNG